MPCGKPGADSRNRWSNRRKSGKRNRARGKPGRRRRIRRTSVPSVLKRRHGMKTSNLCTVLRGLSGVAILLVTGCGPTQTVNPFALRKENTQLKTALRQYQEQAAREKQRADSLDQDNEQIHNELALQQEAAKRA